MNLILLTLIIIGLGIIGYESYELIKEVERGVSAIPSQGCPVPVYRIKHNGGYGPWHCPAFKP